MTTNYTPGVNLPRLALRAEVATGRRPARNYPVTGLRPLAVLTWLCLMFAVTGFTAPTVTQVAGGGSHTVFVESDGSLWGMGYNGQGELGLGFTPASTNRPQLVVSSNVTAIVCGGNHTLFKASGSLWAMGYNPSGQLGDGTYVAHYFPEQIVSSQVTAMAAGRDFSLFGQYYPHYLSGSLWGMGDNQYGQLGLSGWNQTNTPQQILSTSFSGQAIIALAAGFAHTLFIKPDGSLWAMGNNPYGQLGDGTAGNSHYTPEQVVASGVTAVAAGSYHSLFLKSDGGLWGMGYNDVGQLGDNSTSDQHSPEQVGANVMAVAAGAFHSLFIKADGSLWAMGYNAYGQLGDGTTNNQHVPVMIVPSNVVAVAAGQYHSLFIKGDGTLWAMGNNDSGQLGDGTTASRRTPVQVVPPAPPQPGITALSLAGSNLNLTGTNGQSGRTYYALTTTNLTLPLAQWTPVGTNTLSADGSFSLTYTNAIYPSARAQFFRLELQN